MAYSTQTMDKMMERVYQLVPVIGHEKALRCVAGDRFDEVTDRMVPDEGLYTDLRARYDAEMSEFADKGGY
jgi:hypothetical protein